MSSVEVHSGLTELEARGVKFKVKPPLGETFFDGMRLAGEEVTMAAMVQALLCVTHINGEPEPPLKNLASAKAMTNRLGFAGVQRLLMWFNDQVNVTPEGLEQAKN